MKETRRPIIGIDVDGVLRNNLGIMVDMYNKEFGTNMKESDVRAFKTDVSFPLIEERLGITASDYFFHVHAQEVFLDAPAYPHVEEDINRLKEFADIVIITYQKDYTNKYFTLQWLEKNFIEPNGICFLKDKTLVHCDALVDDNDWNFLGTHVKTSVLVTQPYNEEVDLVEFLPKTNSDSIVRVSSLHEFTEMYVSGKLKL